MATWNRFVKWITHIVKEILVDLVEKIIDFKKKQNGKRRLLHMLTYSTTKRRNGWLSSDRCTNYLTFYINVVLIYLKCVKATYISVVDENSSR